MKLSVIVDDFSQGEVSPLSLAKLSSAEVKNGVSENINMIPDAHGPLVGRQGLKHQWVIPATDNSASLYDLEMYEGKSLCLVLYDDQLTIYNVSAEQVTVETFTTPYTAELLHGADRNAHNVEVTKSPDGTSVYFLHSSVAPWVLTVGDLVTPSDTDLDATFAAVSFTSMPSEWSGDNYPTAMTFFQFRTWWGGCKDNPETFWGSKSYAPHDLTTGTLAADACKFTLEKEGLIKWLSGHSSLLIGTSWGEYIASGSNTTIEPSDVQIDPQSAYGSRRITPEFIGDEVLYVSPDGSKLRSMWWRWIESGWKSIDLTYTWEHLTRDRIKDIAYARDPNSIIWVITETGEIICCSFRRSNEKEPTVGAGQIELGGSVTEATGICTVQDDGKSYLMVAAKVTVDGAEELHLMRMDVKNIYADEIVCLDNYTEHTLASGETEITGLTQYEGQTVDIVADGAVLPSRTVTDGTIDLDYHHDTVYVGYWYPQAMTTLPYFLYEKQMAHQKKRWSKIWVYISNSFVPEINGKQPPTRHVSTPMGEGEEPYTGLVMASNKGWDREAVITIEQKVPLHLVLLGIYGEVSLETD